MITLPSQLTAGKQTKGAWYRRWRKVSLDGSTLDGAHQEETRDLRLATGRTEGDDKGQLVEGFFRMDSMSGAVRKARSAAASMRA